MSKWKGEYSADGGALKIYSSDMSVDFLNGVGDGTFSVELTEGYRTSREWDFIGSFVVRTVAYISGYDCSYDPVYELPKGRYAVYRNDNGNMLISYWDDLGLDD
jgi:hypothetical protein